MFKNKQETQEALFEAAKNGGIASIDKVICVSADVQAKDIHGNTSLAFRGRG